VLIEAFKAGKFDIRQENISRNWHNSYNIEKVRNGEIIKREIKNSNPTGLQTFVLNLRKLKFQNIALRKAMTYAFNFEWLRKHIFYGSYERTESYFANSEFAYNANKNHPTFNLPKSDESSFGRDNLVIAKKILDDAGYKIIAGKLIDPASQKPVVIEFLIDTPTFEMIISPFVKNLRKLGIDAKTRFIEENQYAARVRNFDFDVIVAVFGQSLIPGNELIRYWHSSQKNIIGAHNISGLDDKIIDDLVEKISRAQNKQDLIKLCQAFDKHMLENYYTVPQWHNDVYRVLYRDIFAMPAVTPKYSLGTDFWWLKHSASH
jgi:microcin C transport system substrate-binding protein